MNQPEFDEWRGLDRLEQLHREAARARLLRQCPSWRSRLAAQLIRLAVRCDPRILRADSMPLGDVMHR